MGTESTQATAPVELLVDDDRLRAWLQVVPGILLSEIEPEPIREVIETAGVPWDDQVASRITEFIAGISEAETAPERFLLAEGTPPEEGIDGELRWSERLQEKSRDSETEDTDQNKRVDYRMRGTIVTVNADEILGTLVAPIPGTPGLDVFAKPILPKKVLKAIVLKENVQLLEDGESVVATTAGRLVFENDTLSIDELVEIPGDVDFNCGNVDATSEVHVKGTVRELFRVKSAKSIVVDGAVEAADVCAGENLVVRGGILGRNKGRVVADGDVHARFCEEANVRVGGDLHVEREIINSTIHVEGRLFLEHGTIIGGDVYARHGIVVNTLGSEITVPTALRVGISARELQQFCQMEDEKQKRESAIQMVKHVVEPMIAHAKRLSAYQKKRATKLISKAEALENESEGSQKEPDRLIDGPDPENQAHVTVQAHLHTGIRLSIGDREARITEEFKGPLRIECRKIENVTEFVAVDQVSNSLLVLKHRRVPITELDKPVKAKAEL